MITYIHMICDLTNKSTMRGNNVSHANNKTGRNFRVNAHWHWFHVPWGRERLKVCRRGLSTIYKNGGLVPTLLQSKKCALGAEGAKLKARLETHFASSVQEKTVAH